MDWIANPWVWVLVAIVVGAAAAIYYVLKPKEKPRQKAQQKRDDVTAEVDKLLKGRTIPGDDFIVGRHTGPDRSTDGDVNATAEAVTKRIEGNHHP